MAKLPSAFGCLTCVQRCSCRSKDTLFTLLTSCVPVDLGEDGFTGRAFCKGYQHFLTFQRTLNPLLFSAVFPPFTLWYFPIFLPSDSLHNEFSCLFIPRLLSFPLSHGVSSSLLYQSFIISHAPQIMVPSPYLLNDDKMHLFAQQLRWNHCRKLLYSLILFDLSLKNKLPHIYHCTFQSTAQGCSMQRQHSFETGAIRSDKTVGYPRGFP